MYFRWHWAYTVNTVCAVCDSLLTEFLCCATPIFLPQLQLVQVIIFNHKYFHPNQFTSSLYYGHFFFICKKDWGLKESVSLAHDQVLYPSGIIHKDHPGITVSNPNIQSRQDIALSALQHGYLYL